MRKIMLIIFTVSMLLNSETLFEVKDASNNPVLDVSTDGLRIMNQGDTLMVISSSEIKANIMNDAQKGLSRTFSVTTTQSKGKGSVNALEVGTDYANMNCGSGRYTDFSPDNLFLGLNSGQNTTTGGGNVFMGNETGRNNTVGWRNIFIGDSAGFAQHQYTTEQIGSDNVFIGTRSGRSNYSGFSNVFIGTETGIHNWTGSQNVLIGWRAGYNLSQGNYNTNIGYLSGSSNENGSYNTCYGYYSGHWNTGDNNTFLGSDCGNNNSTGSSNTFIGKSTGWYNETGNYNVLLGMEAGKYNRTGSNNTLIGHQAGSGSYNVNTTGNVCLGYQAGATETLSNKLYIANTSTTTPLIKGTFPNTDLTFTANNVSVIHPIGETVNGLKIQTTYNGNTDSWHFYQQTDDELGLYYNTGLRGSYNITSGVYTSVSDRKLKKNIENIKNISDKIMDLQPVKYNFTDQKDNERKYIGLIAQDVEKLFPEFVNYNEESDTYTMDYSGLSVIAIQAIKEQQSEIDELKKQIDELRGMIKK